MTAGCKPTSLLEFLLARPISDLRAATITGRSAESPYRRRPVHDLGIAFAGRIRNKSIRGRNKLAVSELVIHVTPANRRSRETHQPDEKRHRVPNRNQRHLCPKSCLF